jgi:hypothetical protein
LEFNKVMKDSYSSICNCRNNHPFEEGPYVYEDDRKIFQRQERYSHVLLLRVHIRTTRGRREKTYLAPVVTCYLVRY